MSNVKTMLEAFEAVVKNPRAQLDAYLKEGKKAIGCMPVYCPEELVYAAGMVPFGLWGAETEVSKAKNYFPAFICSILQTTLELGLAGAYDGMSAVMIPYLCDSLKCMTGNWKYGVKNIEAIPVPHAQNRKIEAGPAFQKARFTKIAKRLEEISGNEITNEKLKEAVAVFNEHRAVIREFAEVAAKYPQFITPLDRSNVIKSGLFMDRPKHTKMVKELIAACNAQEVKEWDGIKIVTTGILVDTPDLLKIFEENHMAIVADEVAQESRQYRTDVPVCEDAMDGIARHLSVMEGCSVLYDPDKKRADMIIDMVRKNGAHGIVIVMTKFCDPEEFDYPILKKAFDAAGIPSVVVEVDQQMRNYEQARTAIQTFADMLAM